MSDYNVDSLREGIERCKKNIETFEEAIENERRTIKEYYEMMETVERKEREAKTREDILATLRVEVEEDDDKI